MDGRGKDVYELVSLAFLHLLLLPYWPHKSAFTIKLEIAIVSVAAVDEALVRHITTIANRVFVI